MRTHKQTSTLLFTCLLTIFACNQNADINKANELVTAANNQVNLLQKDLDAVSIKINKLQPFVLAQRSNEQQPQTEQPTNSNKDEAKTLAQSIINDYAKLMEGFKEVENKFASASKMNVRPILQQYWSLKAQGWQKRVPIFVLKQNNIKLILEAIEKNDMSGIEQKIAKNNLEMEQLDKEVRDIDAKAEKMVSDNPKDFNKNI